MNKKMIGYFLLTIGFLGAALISVLEILNVQWGYFLGMCVIAVIGIVVIRSEMHKESTHDRKLSEDITNLGQSLDKILAEFATIKASDAMKNPYDLHETLDVHFPQLIDTFVEARGTIGHVHGLHAYADVMSAFAAGERYLNRVWSASADGYIDESHEYMDRAEEQFKAAQSQFQALG